MTFLAAFLLNKCHVLSAAFAPLLILYASKEKISEKLAICIILFGVTGTLAWRYTGLSSTLYEVGPGIIIGLLSYFFLKGTPPK